jgi:hypothetical protein
MLISYASAGISIITNLKSCSPIEDWIGSVPIKSFHLWFLAAWKWKQMSSF